MRAGCRNVYYAADSNLDWCGGMELQEAFDTTAKVIFGRELGRLDDFAPYLKEIMSPYQMQKSAISGKEVMLSSDFYPEGAAFVSQDEVGKLKFEPLTINEIKDIDSLFESVHGRAIYCGNKLFGRNNDVQEVDNCVDCTNVRHATNVFSVKHGAYLSYLRESEHVFGVWGFPNSQFSIRVGEGVRSSRCFESYYCTDISQTYYVFNCIGCQDCMFSFNLRSGRHRIGNLQLSKEHYRQLKAKLVDEMADELSRKKKLFSVVDLAFYGRDKKDMPEEKIAYCSPVPHKVEEAWSSASRIIFGKEHKGVRNFAGWLSRYSVKVKKIKGALGSPTYKVEQLPIIGRLPGDRLVTLEEGVELAKKPISLKEGSRPSLQELLPKIAKIAYFSVEFVDGQNENCVDTPSIFTGSNNYKVWDVTNGKCSAYTGGVVHSEHIFGSGWRMLRCQFCVCCNDSTSIKGCFEVDSSYSTRDSYLCHNVENCENCILCFNAKSLRYAVGNTEVGKGEFLRMKKMLLDYINGELGLKKSVDFGVFSLPKVVKNR